jgi:hypothetical protein
MAADVDASQIATARIGRSAMLAAARASAADTELDKGPPAPAATKRTGVVLVLVLAALAAGAGAAAVIAFAPKAEPPKAERVLVIEKQGVEPGAATEPGNAPAAVASEPPAAPAPSEAPASGPAPKAVAPSGPIAPASANRGSGLARAFQRQEGKIQRCFEQNPGGLAGDPRIAVRFHIDTAGVVKDAVVTPSSVAGTALGGCLLGVARATSFGPQPEPISFSIPIAARVVRR